MQVVIVEPEKKPVVQNIDDTLTSMQQIVGGTIQAVYPFEEPVALICNDEGKLLNLPLNRIANKYAEAGETGKMYVPNVVCGQLIGFACRFIPAVIVLTSLTLASGQGDFASIIPGWVTTLLSVFGGMMAALGMGIILSFLLKKQYHIVIFLAGFILVTYFGLSTMAVAVVSVITAVLYFVAYDKVKVEA